MGPVAVPAHCPGCSVAAAVLPPLDIVKIEKPNQCVEDSCRAFVFVHNPQDIMLAAFCRFSLIFCLSQEMKDCNESISGKARLLKRQALSTIHPQKPKPIPASKAAHSRSRQERGPGQRAIGTDTHNSGQNCTTSTISRHAHHHTG